MVSFKGRLDQGDLGERARADHQCHPDHVAMKCWPAITTPAATLKRESPSFTAQAASVAAS